ncbi:MAG: cobalamin-dependent protein [Nitrospirae bacterium YQR-1]
MARVLLISCNTTVEPYPVYPLGMAMIAGALTAAGHTVAEYDMLASPQLGYNLEDMCRDFNPEITGLSIRNIDNLNYAKPESYLEQYKRVVETLHGISSAPVVMGGAGFSLFPSALMESCGADYGVVGQGEILFVELVARLTNGRRPAQKLFYSTGGGHSESCSFSYRNSELSGFYLKHGGMLNLFTKRGCPMKCAYCSYPLLEGSTYRFRTAVDVVDEIEALRDNFNMDYYAIADSVFNDVDGNYLNIARELIRRKIDIPFTAFLRPQGFSSRDVELLKRAGLKTVEFGTDASTDTTLMALKKGFTWKEVLLTNELFAGNSVAVNHFIIFGGPGETTETFKQGLQNVQQIEHAVVMANIGFRIIPDTYIHGLAIRENRLSKENNLTEPVYYFSPYIDPAHIDRELRESFALCRERVYPVGSQDLDKVKIFHQMGHRGPIWDYLLKRKR